MKCTNCEANPPSDGDYVFCPYCGKKLPQKVDYPILEEYTLAQVKEHFVRLYRMAVQLVEHQVTHGHRMKDEHHWCYEAVMKILGEDIFAKLRELD